MQKTDAIVLNFSPYSETTLIVHLLTRDLGVGRVLAKGALRPRSRYQGVIERFAWIRCELTLRAPDKLGTLGGADEVAQWPYLRQDMPRLAYASLGLELIARIAEDSPEEPVWFEEAVAFLRLLGEVSAPGSLTIALMIRLLHEGGFQPQLPKDWSPRSIPRTLSYDFSRAKLTPHQPDNLHAMHLPGEAVATILSALREPVDLNAAFEVPARFGPLLIRWLVRLWEDHLRTRLKSADFLEKMVFGKTK